MLIGMTYDLRDDYLARGMSLEEALEFDSLETIESIETVLTDLGHRVERIGSLEPLIAALMSGRRWDLVFNIAEGVRGIGREAQVPALLDAYDIPYVFSDPLVLSLTLDKGMTKRVIRDLGVATPDFAVVREPADIDAVDLAYPLFAKPNGEGTGKGIDAASKVQDAAQLRRVCLDLLARFRQPVLVERYLPGREFTVGVVGNGSQARTTGVMEVHFLNTAEAGAYTMLNKEDWRNRCRYTRADDEPEGRAAAEVALAAWRGLGCRDGGRVDVRLDETGRAHFIEVNPLAGLNPSHSDLPMLSRFNGMDFHALIGAILDAAVERLGLNAATETGSAAA